MLSITRVTMKRLTYTGYNDSQIVDAVVEHFRNSPYPIQRTARSIPKKTGERWRWQGHNSSEFSCRSAYKVEQLHITHDGYYFGCKRINRLTRRIFLRMLKNGYVVKLPGAKLPKTITHRLEVPISYSDKRDIAYMVADDIDAMFAAVRLGARVERILDGSVIGE